MTLFRKLLLCLKNIFKATPLRLNFATNRLPSCLSSVTNTTAVRRLSIYLVSLVVFLALMASRNPDVQFNPLIL